MKESDLFAVNVTRVAAIVAGAVLVLGFWFLVVNHQADAVGRAALERQIGASMSEAQILRARARAILPVAETTYVEAKARQDDYQVLRAGLAVDPVALTISGPTFTPVNLPAPVVRLVLACDTTIVALRSALDTTRAAWALERAAADTQLVADSLKDLRQPRHSRCGFKCGVAVGAVTTVAAIAAAVKIVRAVAERPRAPSLTPIPLRR